MKLIGLSKRIEDKFQQLFDKYYDNADAIARGEAVDLPAYLTENYPHTPLESSDVEKAMEMLMSETQPMTAKENENEGGDVPNGH